MGDAAVEPRVFVSYSSEDREVLEAVCRTLEAAGIRCWIAPRDIAPGREWAEAIVDAITASRALVLIFSAHADASPQVRREVELATARGLTIIPFRIEEVLPGQALEYFVGTVHWLDAFAPSPEAHLDRLTAAVRDALAADARRRRGPGPPRLDARALAQRLRALRGEARFRQIAVGASVAVALLAALLGLLYVLDFFALDTRVDTYTMALGALASPPTFSPDLVLVGIGPEVDRAAWRRHEAALVDRLSEAGVKVIAFDLFFEAPDDGDAELRRAIEAARARGVAVVVGARKLSGDQPLLAETLRGAPSDWGAVCLGRKLGYAWLGPVAIEVEAPSDRVLVVRSLALASLAAFRQIRVGRVDEQANRLVTEDEKNRKGVISVSSTRRIAEVQSTCPIVGGTGVVASSVIELSSVDLLRDPRRRHTSSDLLSEAGAGRLAGLRGRLVLVGAEVAEDAHAVGVLGQPRYGFELHADALNTLMQGRTIRWLGAGGQLGLALGTALLGGLIRRAPILATPRRRRAALALAALVYLVAAVLAFVQLRILLRPLYHLVALVGAYVLVARLERRWLAEPLRTEVVTG